MNCEMTRRHLDALVDGELPFWAAWRLERHVAHCADCAAARDAAQRLTERARSWADVTAPAGLGVRMLSSATMAAPAMPARPRQAPLRLRQLAVAAAALVLGIGLTLGLRVHGNAGPLLRQMVKAVSQAQSVHMVLSWRTGPNQDGPVQSVEEIWYQDGRWRKTSAPDEGGDRIIRQGAHGLEYYRYEPYQGKVVEVPEGARQPGSGDFTFEGLAGTYFPIGASPQTTSLGQVNLNGRTLIEVQASVPEAGERMLFWLDPKTDLPVRAEKWDLNYKTMRWEMQGQMELDFNQTIPPAIFDPQTLHP